MKGPTTTPKKAGGGGSGETNPKSKERTKVKDVKNKDQQTATTPTPNIPTRKRSSPKEEVDLSQLSAYAVYNNLVPGVKSYEDTSESTPASLRKKSKKRKKAEVKKQEDEAAAANAVKTANSATTAMNISSKIQPSATKPAAANSPRRITPIPVHSTTVAGENGHVNFGKKNQVVAAAPTASGEGESAPKKKKKRRKNKKKKKANAETEVVATKDVSVNGGNSHKNTTATTEPPRKVRKIDQKEEVGNLLPNPLANTSSIGKNAGLKKNGKQTVDAEAILKLKENTKPKTDLVPKNQTATKKGKASRNQDSDSDEVAEVTSTSSLSLANSNATRISNSSEPPELNSIFNSKVVFDSVEHGKELFAWLIHPQSISAFMEDHWEKQALLVKRGELFPEYFDWILSSAKLDDILRRNNLKYTKNIDVVYYDKGERVTVSEDMTHRVRPAALWDYYSTGNSIRLLNPQTYCSPLRRLNSALQETFGTFVGANVYLTPPDSQGFAPHWDDIEAFVLQVEGKKRWKLYKPRKSNEVLPRYSSKDFGKEEETLGAPFIDVILEPGDLLYFPRGTIHQAMCIEGFHSMHITISCYQQNCWADLLKQHFSKAVDKLASSDVEFRKGLPLDYLSFMGMAPSQKKDSTTVSKRKEFKAKLKRLVAKVGDLDADDGADEMGKKFIWDSLPPYLTRKEKDKTVEEDGEFLNNGKVKNRVEMDPDTKVKLIRKHCVRLISEESTFRLYHTLENPLVYHEEEPNFVEISEEFRPAVEFLINSYPEYVRIEDLPISDDDLTKKIQITADLWERGVIMTEKRLEAGEIDNEEFDFDFDEGESLSHDEEDEFDDGDEGSDMEDFIEGDDVGFDMDSSNDDDEDDDDEGSDLEDFIQGDDVGSSDDDEDDGLAGNGMEMSDDDDSDDGRGENIDEQADGVGSGSDSEDDVNEAMENSDDSDEVVDSESD